MSYVGLFLKLQLWRWGLT